jgi:hypothetical protein
MIPGSLKIRRTAATSHCRRCYMQSCFPKENGGLFSKPPFRSPIKRRNKTPARLRFFLLPHSRSCIPLYKKADTRDYPHKLSALRLTGYAPLRLIGSAPLRLAL